MRISSTPAANHLISALPADARERWLPQLAEVALPQGCVLHESGCPMNAVYFPTTAVISLVYETAEGASMELAVVGHEGVVGVELLLGGGSTPSRAVVHTAGSALRLPARVLQEEFDQASTAAPLLLRYIMALTTQVAQTAVCARHHSLEQRLCRWLLQRWDRVTNDRIVATQEQIAGMLGVRREGVTEAALHLQQQHVIRYSRGLIVVLDRPALERHACECYAAVKKEYFRLLPGLASSARLGQNREASSPAQPPPTLQVMLSSAGGARASPGCAPTAHAGPPGFEGRHRNAAQQH